ncbi:hypothetical protein ILUMI_26585 [Ignelater luminosus]|uniref:Uncharacterized protein n=1 Tax=Ignelater luminosus TaxID=2038154 RepID=A0A8K0FYI6_IGNLU|nr:hypothetical protein ILUMI_26585 [Ignelater luminosus]
MMKCIKLLIPICILLYVSVEAKQYTDDYCWRDYNGVVPLDAFEAGFDKDGKILYIGQVLHEKIVVPGKIYDGDKNAYFEFYDVEHTSTQNIKILCSRSKNTLQWIATQHNEANNLVPHNTLIKGGYEDKCSTYLGRSKRRPGAEIGKVMCCEAATHCYGLYTTRNGKGDLEVEFDILAYNDNNSDSGNDINNINYSDTSTTKKMEFWTTFTTEKVTPMTTTISLINRPIDRCKQITINLFY